VKITITAQYDGEDEPDGLVGALIAANLYDIDWSLDEDRPEPLRDTYAERLGAEWSRTPKPRMKK
jgi:hypothetical protein